MIAMIVMASSATNDNLSVFQQIHYTDDGFGIQRLLLVDWDCVASFGYRRYDGFGTSTVTDDGFGTSTVTDNVLGTSVVTDDGFGASTVTNDDFGASTITDDGDTYSFLSSLLPPMR
jgi:hypothetical protein